MTDTISLQLTWEEAEALNTLLNIRGGFFKLADSTCEGSEAQAAERACTKLHTAVTGAPSPWSEFTKGDTSDDHEF
jgi:hypothetical protein